MNDAGELYAATAATLYAMHQLGDHWIQSDHDAQAKGRPGWDGRRACATHVATLTITKVIGLGLMLAVTGLRPAGWALVLGLAVDAGSHYWADRRTTLARLAELVPGKAAFWQLGAPRAGHDDNPSLGTGAYALDQSWHIGWLFIAALLIAL